VEDLLLLLAFIQQHHPEIQAVATGAIASDYQRLRVENVSPAVRASYCCCCCRLSEHASEPGGGVSAAPE
jgi:hypothetical protein